MNLITSQMIRPVVVQTVDGPDGILTVVESGKHFDFAVQRVFVIADVPAGTLRGGHAHKAMRELLICVSGAVDVVATDGVAQTTTRLDSPEAGLLIAPGIWLTQRYLVPGTVLLALCDTLYDEADYLRDYDAFLAYRRAQTGLGA